MLDGVDNNSISGNVQELTTQIVRPSVDSIQEFKVSTNPYSAENGRSPGSLVSVTTKSGSNAFHGTAYEFLRNRVFDANNFFNNRSGLIKPQNIQNQFGGNVGGPVLKIAPSFSSTMRAHEFEGSHAAGQCADRQRTPG